MKTQENQHTAQYKWLVIPDNQYFYNRKDVKRYVGGEEAFRYMLHQRFIIYLPPTKLNND